MIMSIYNSIHYLVIIRLSNSYFTNTTEIKYQGLIFLYITNTDSFKAVMLTRSLVLRKCTILYYRFNIYKSIC